MNAWLCQWSGADYGLDTGSTDNLGNTHVLNAPMCSTTSCRASTPLSIVVMGLAVQLKHLGLEMDPRWIPRGQNSEADSLTSSEFMSFDPAKRTTIDSEKTKFKVMIMELDDEIKLAKSSKKRKQICRLGPWPKEREVRLGGTGQANRSSPFSPWWHLWSTNVATVACAFVVFAKQRCLAGAFAQKSLTSVSIIPVNQETATNLSKMFQSNITAPTQLLSHLRWKNWVPRTLPAHMLEKPRVITPRTIFTQQRRNLVCCGWTNCGSTSGSNWGSIPVFALRTGTFCQPVRVGLIGQSYCFVPAGTNIHTAATCDIAKTLSSCVPQDPRSQRANEARVGLLEDQKLAWGLTLPHPLLRFSPTQVLQKGPGSLGRASTVGPIFELMICSDDLTRCSLTSTEPHVLTVT